MFKTDMKILLPTTLVSWQTFLTIQIVEGIKKRLKSLASSSIMFQACVVVLALLNL